MTLIRCEHDKEHPYLMVARGVAQNKAISYEALGLLTYLLSQAEDWKVVPENLIREGCGRNRVYKLLNELKEAGHVIQQRGQAAHDKPPLWGERVVVEQPNPSMSEMARNLSNQDTVTPDTANAGYGKNAPINTNQETKQRQEQNNTTARARNRKDFDDVPKQDRLEIIQAWADNLPIPPVNVYNRDAYHATAAEIFREGYRAHQVALFVKAKMQDDFWLGKTLSLAKVGELMPQWLLTYKNGAGPSPIRAVPKSVTPVPQAASTSVGAPNLRSNRR